MSEVRRRLRRRRLLQVAGGIVVAAVAIASVVLVLDLRDGRPSMPVADLDASEPEEHAPDDLAGDADDLQDPHAAQPRVAGGAWTRVPPDADVFGVGREEPMADVTSGGPGLVAVGHDSRLEAGVVWVSEDGAEWERVPHDDAAHRDAGADRHRRRPGGGRLRRAGGSGRRLAQRVALRVSDGWHQSQLPVAG